MKNEWKAWLFASAAVGVLMAASPAFAADSAADKAKAQAQLDALQQRVQALDAEVAALKQAQADADPAPALADLKRSTSNQYADLTSQLAAQTSVSVNNGRFTIASADGKFSASLRALMQLDTGAYSQSAAASALPAAYGPDLGSGANFRRVYLGLSGKLFGGWSYNANFDFGGSGGTETPGHIQSVYLQYDGWAPWAIRAGAFPPPANIEDGTSAPDTIFLERNSPSDLQRNIAGGDGRDAFTVLYAGPTLFGAVSLTGNKVSDGTKALAAGSAVAANFDEQQAVLGRAAWLAVNTPDIKWLVGVNGTYVAKLPDLVANGTTANLSNTPGAAARNTVTLSDPPELTIDSNGTALATSGALPAKHVSQWGVETAATFGSLYGQAGYYGFQVDRSPIAYNQFTAAGVSAPVIVKPTNNNFSGWYVQAAWTVTGETKAYNAANGAFSPPKPTNNFALDGSGWGALELTARYSDLNLNDNALDTSNVVTNWVGTSKTYTYYNQVRGGDQRIVTLGANWYPNSVVRVALNYELIQSSRLQSAALPTGQVVTTAGTPVVPTLNGGQNAQAVALRIQFSL